jgi:hypothetical protein
MSDTLSRVQSLVRSGTVEVSRHGLLELAADDILLDDVVAGIESATLVEEYTEYAKGPCVLALQSDSAGKPLHILWGIPKDRTEPAVLVTAYRPDADRWSADFMRRK